MVDESGITPLELELLRWISTHNDRGLGIVHRDFLAHARAACPQVGPVSKRRIMEAVWALVRTGLAYLDYDGGSSLHWGLVPTAKGKTAAGSGELNPYDTEAYLKTLRAKAPQVSETVRQYAHQALVTFRNDCFLASAVMLGVASEAAFLEMAAAFAKWLPGNEGDKFRELVASTRRDYVDKFREFRPRFQKYRSQMPGDAGDNLTLDAIADLLRIYRNDCGHPTGRQVSREDAFANLRMFVSYTERLYRLKTFFETSRGTAESSTSR